MKKKENIGCRIGLYALILAFAAAALSGCYSGKKAALGKSAEGDAAYEAGDYLTAIDRYSEAIALDAQLDEAYNNRGLARVKRAEELKTEADKLLPALVAEDGSVPEDDAENSGSAEAADGETDESAVESEAPEPFAEAREKLLLEARNLYELALNDFSEAIRLNPLPQYFYNRGSAYFTQDKKDEAYYDFSRAIVMNEEYVAAYLGRAQVNASRGEVANALDDYSTALSIDPEQPMALNARGLIYYQKGDYYVAVEDFSKALRYTTPKDERAIILLNRAECYRKLNEAASAVQDYESYLQNREDVIDETYFSVLLNMAQCYEQQWKNEEAAATYARLLVFAPENRDALIGQAEAYYNSEHFAEAYQAYTKLLKVEENEVFLAMRADCALNIEMPEDALKDLNRAIALSPEYAWAYYLRSEVYTELGQLKKAKADLETAKQWTEEIDIEDDDDWGDDILPDQDFE